MCGIAGIVAYGPSAPAVNVEELLQTREHMLRRGPDGAGLWLAENGRVGLAHRRLAILDLSPAGAQPMATPDGRFHIVFNGEIYNYQTLRSELQAEGVVFRSDSDTEVLLQMYARHGAAMCRRLLGMYAFAIWDAQARRLFLARDPFGIKPLYLHDDGKTLRFASQVKALLAGGGIDAQPEPAGHVGFWVWGFVPEPWSLYKDLASLPAGTHLTVHADGRREAQCFDSVTNGWQEPAPHAGTLRDALLKSVRLHLMADVPVGVFLSSGIDSTVLAALAAECGAPLRTVTLGFEEYRGTAQDETPLAAQVARQYGATHSTVWTGAAEFAEQLPRVLQAMDQPSADGLNTWLVARAASQTGLKVAVSGLGGDEFFGGYPAFRQLPGLRRWAGPVAQLPGLGRAVRRLLVPWAQRRGTPKAASLLEYAGSWEGAYLLRRALHLPWSLPVPEEGNTEFLQQGLQRLGLQEGPYDEPRLALDGFATVSCLEATRYMRSQLLRDSDWAGMDHSLEIRVPLVDRAVLARLAALRPRAGKQDLAACARPPLPPAVLARAKTGFTVPLHRWLAQVPQASGSALGFGSRAWQQRVGQAFAVRGGWA
jgi:asparagine synthase (glutamine-hydrolysing)